MHNKFEWIYFLKKKMAYANNSVKQLVSENSVDDFIAASDILIKFASNVLDNPSDKKYRRIRIANPTVQNKLLNIVGGIECLFEMGFEEIEDGEFLMLPLNANLQLLKNIKDDLQQEREKLCKKPKANTPGISISSSDKAAKPQTQPIRTNYSFLESEAAFLASMKGGLSRVLHYENPSARQKALTMIPLDSLQSEARKSLQAQARKSLQSEDRKNSESNRGAKPMLDMRDFLLLALLGWFKKSFFHWVDTLLCSLCNRATSNTGSLVPTADDLRWGASRVEAHTCSTCSFVNRFPRYTNAEKLLETRKGRCGEWADCFTLCCRALDFEARYVIDSTDHVWTEVYSESQSRWLHCDPCENICDKPLLYETGWGKKLTYVIAVSRDDIQDVTWRYSAKHNEVLARRTLCRESWLRKTIYKLLLQKLSTLAEERQKQLWKRRICELADFLVVQSNDGENLPGRTTGSLAWRQARGELGRSDATRSVIQKNFVFRPAEAERECELIHVVYSCAANKYIHKSAKDKEYLGWEKCIYSANHVFRKEESDWKMVYLAREEGSSSAEVVWKFDLSDTDLRISKMEIRAQTAVYENGSISWRFCAGDNCFMETGASLQQLKSFDLRGCQSLSVTVLMQGGKGELAWQHTQLFRQSANDLDNYPFEIKLFLN